MLCCLDSSATATRRALLDLVSRSMARGQAELLFVGDETFAAAGPRRSVIAVRLHRRADAERLADETRKLASIPASTPTGGADHASARLDTRLLSVEPATIGTLPLGPMFP